MDAEGRRVLNLTALQRLDPAVEDILITAAHVTLCDFNIDLNQWSRKDVEGSQFVVKRNTQPRFQFIVMNRRNTGNGCLFGFNSMLTDASLGSTADLAAGGIRSHPNPSSEEDPASVERLNNKQLLMQNIDHALD